MVVFSFDMRVCGSLGWIGLEKCVVQLGPLIPLALLMMIEMRPAPHRESIIIHLEAWKRPRHLCLILFLLQFLMRDVVADDLARQMNFRQPIAAWRWSRHIFSHSAHRTRLILSFTLWCASKCIPSLKQLTLSAARRGFPFGLSLVWPERTPLGNSEEEGCPRWKSWWQTSPLVL